MEGHNPCLALFDDIVENRRNVVAERDALLKAVRLYMKLDCDRHAGIDLRDSDWGECWEAADAAIGMIDTNTQKSLDAQKED